MHPAYSVILFTTASGAGYGLLTWLGIAALFNSLPSDPAAGVVGLGLALLLITAGLLSSTFHLGHPERAWRAFSQWQTSWLSREGVLAVATYVPAGLFGLGWVLGEGWGAAFFGPLAAVLAVATVYATGMIYASLRTVPKWNRSSVPFNYVTLALATGGLLFLAWQAAFQGQVSNGAATAAAIAVGAAAVAKLTYWLDVDNLQPNYTPEMATGLGDGRHGQKGGVRQLEAPHTQANFVMREMGYHVARKHADRLRLISAGLLFALPFAVALIIPSTGTPLAMFLALMAVGSAGIGVLVERWLFFAEADHVVTLYYGARAV